VISEETVMPKVGVLLAGCGVLDGSEVYESVLTILAIEHAGAEVAAIAPDVTQSEVINHYRGDESRTGEAGGPSRSVLAESARIVRGKITSIKEVSAHNLDALIIPGGYGVVKNLCSYAEDGENARIDEDVKRLIVEMVSLGKPIGAICIAPVLVALAVGDRAPALTIGNDAKTGVDLQRMGAVPFEVPVDGIHVDENLKIVSTPAFMLAERASEAEDGINQLVAKVLELAAAN
jgi:enhancing lycopene biosynthesis protein 2